MKYLVIGLVLTSGLITSSAFAQQTLAKEKDWTLMLQTSSDQQSICVMSTSDKVKKSQYSLEIMKRRGVSSPVEIFIRQVGADIQAAGLVGYFEAKQLSSYYSFAQLSSDGQTTTFMHIPKSTQMLFQSLISKKELKVVTRGGLVKEQKIEFSYKGFAKVLAVFQSSCMNGLSASNDEFEAEFLADLQRNIDPLAMNPAGLGQMRSLLSEAFNLHLQKKQNLAALAELRAQYLSQIQESQRLTALVSEISGKGLPLLRSSLSRSEVDQKKSESDLASVTSRIPGYEEQLRQASARHNAAQRAIAPFVDEFNSRSSALSSAEDMVESSVVRLNQINGSLSSLSRQIVELDNEARQLEYTMSRLRDDLRRAEYDLREAQRANRSYNENAEIRRQLDSDSTYQSNLRELTSAQRELERLDAAKRAAQTELQRKQEELRACQGIAGAACPTQEAAVAQAQTAVGTANSAFETQRSRVRTLQSQVDSRREGVEREVRRFKDRLESAERERQRRYDDVYDSHRRAELRLQVIVTSEIPSRQNTIRQLESERPMVENQIQSGRAQVQQLSGELARFRQRVGWDAKKAELDTAADLESEKDNQLSSARASKLTLEKLIVTLKHEQESLKLEITRQSQILAQSQSRLGVVNNELQPYVKRNAELDLVGAGLQRQWDDKKSRYVALLPQI